MKINELKELLTQHARGFYVTQEAEEYKNGETVSKIKRHFIPGDIRAVQMLLELNKIEPFDTEETSIEELSLGDTVMQLQVAVDSSEDTLKTYKQLSFFDSEYRA